jgi:hypothetical protein
MKREATGHVTLKLTTRQAKFLWGILDGAADAGACEGGLTPMEQRTISQISDKLLPFMLRGARP